MASLIRATGPFRHRNVRLYSCFTIAFNARFYYPILAILFLDLGLSLEQFVVLNAIWAATIFLAEVPSGALADIIGRKKLLVAAGGFMVFEMLALLLAPKDAGMWLFSLCALNRILSGLAEAAASGADQALAYDSLKAHGEEETWDEVLESTMRWQSIAMTVAMILGAVLYDASLVGKLIPVSQEQTLRIPIALCLIQAVIAFLISLRFRELDDAIKPDASLSAVLAQTWRATLWVFTTKTALLIVIGGVIIDSITRNFATINSEYYRLVNIPTYTFGFIAAGIAMIGFFVPRLSKSLARNFSPLTNLTLTAAWVLLCLVGLAQAWDIWGVVPAAAIMASLWHLGFLMSRYLNELSSSDQRATVLSVKGLIFNVGYGTISLIFSGLVAYERGRSAGDNEAFTAALTWQPWGFAIIFLTFLIIAHVARQKFERKVIE